METQQATNPNLTLGAFIDVSMFIRIDSGDWSKISETDPVDIVMDIPGEYKDLGNKFYILRIHNGVPTLLEDKDDDPDTITISSGDFSTYAIVYEKIQEDEESTTGVVATAPVEKGDFSALPIVGIGAVAVILLLLFLAMRRKSSDSK